MTVASTIAQLSQRLASEAKRLEPDFVRLTSGLSGLANNAGAVAELGANLAAQVETRLEALRATGLGVLIGDAHSALRGSLQVAESQIAQLTKNAAALLALSYSGRRMRSLGTELSVIRLGFSIETARLQGKHMVEFRDVVQQLVEVEHLFFRLGGKVTETASEGAGRQRGAATEIRRGLSELNSMAGRCDAVAGSAASSVAVLLESFGRLATEVAGAVGAVRTQTQEIVYFLQIGDIVRQKVEHVAEALARLAYDPSASPRVLLLQTAQLERVVDDLKAAHEKLSTAFVVLDESTTRVLELLLALTTATDYSNDGPSFSALLRDTRTIEELRRRADELRANVARAADAAFGSVKGIVDHLAEVNRINTTMQMKAQNAMIKTARIGEKASALGVLSVQVYQVAKSSGALVSEVMPQVDRLRESLQRETEKSEASVEVDGANVERGLDELEQLHGEVTAAGGQASDLAATHRHSLDAAKRDIEFLPAIRDEFAAVAASMRTTLKSLGAVEALGDQAEAFASYTMESEREVHRSLMGKDAEPAAEPVAAGAGGDDNVELF